MSKIILMGDKQSGLRNASETNFERIWWQNESQKPMEFLIMKEKCRRAPNAAEGTMGPCPPWL